MAPKPFPFPLSVGIDICRISRIAALLRREQTRNRWAQKVFTRVEWAALCRKFLAANAGTSVKKVMKGKNQQANQDTLNKENLWMLPKLSNFTLIFEDEVAYWEAINDARSPLGTLARHLAGRWAAKEAVIKAHHHRRLSVNEISIVVPHSPSRNTNKLIALVDPVCDTIRIADEGAAVKRGLRGFVAQSQGLNNKALMEVDNDDGKLPNQDKAKLGGVRRFDRRMRVHEWERQVAEVNISHDGDYAVAVCMAFDPPGAEGGQKVFVDHGSGHAKHEPQWGDKGWFDSHVDKPVEGEEMDDLKADEGDLEDDDSEAFKKAFKKALKGSERDAYRRLPPLP